MRANTFHEMYRALHELFLPASSPPLDYFQAPIHFSAWVSSVPGGATCAKSSIDGVKSDIIV